MAASGTLRSCRHDDVPTAVSQVLERMTPPDILTRCWVEVRVVAAPCDDVVVRSVLLYLITLLKSVPEHNSNSDHHHGSMGVLWSYLSPTERDTVRCILLHCLRCLVHTGACHDTLVLLQFIQDEKGQPDEEWWHEVRCMARERATKGDVVALRWCATWCLRDQCDDGLAIIAAAVKCSPAQDVVLWDVVWHLSNTETFSTVSEGNFSSDVMDVVFDVLVESLQSCVQHPREATVLAAVRYLYYPGKHRDRCDTVLTLLATCVIAWESKLSSDGVARPHTTSVAHLSESETTRILHPFLVSLFTTYCNPSDDDCERTNSPNRQRVEAMANALVCYAVEQQDHGAWDRTVGDGCVANPHDVLAYLWNHVPNTCAVRQIVKASLYKNFEDNFSMPSLPEALVAIIGL